MIRRFLSKLFVGRYGFDKLSYALLAVGFILGILVSVLHLPLAGLIYSSKVAFIIFRVINIITYVPYFIAFYRAFSKNFDKRRKEEKAFMKVAGKWIKYFTQKLLQRKDKEHRYFNCPTCHRTLRVPRNRGKIKIDCPHCGKQFTRKT